MAHPWIVATEPRLKNLARLSAIQEFLNRSLGIFQEALKPGGHAGLRNLLLNDAPVGMREPFHLALPSSVFKIPMFFRTDESADGRIFEVQCPGSGWGDLALLRQTFELQGVDPRVPDVAQTFAMDLAQMAPHYEQGVMHLLDASSNPNSMQYFIRETSSRVPYWGISSVVSYGGCRLIRGHSAAGIVAENLFSRRVALCGSGELRFDLPPIALFDQKIPLVLPFCKETRDQFPEAVRECLVFTALATTEGFESPDGEWISFDSFERRPSVHRQYVFKYAGFDTTENWGSRGVRFGNDKKIAQHLRKIRSAISKGRPWIVQPETSHVAEVAVVGREGSVIVESRHVKLSRFYGPHKYYGAKVMASTESLVHGQSDTAVTIAYDS